MVALIMDASKKGPSNFGKPSFALRTSSSPRMRHKAPAAKQPAQRTPAMSRSLARTGKQEFKIIAVIGVIDGSWTRKWKLL